LCNAESVSKPLCFISLV